MSREEVDGDKYSKNETCQCHPMERNKQMIQNL